MPGPWELVIVLVVALLLFGGSRVAGLGKGVGRSIREFKEEVKAVEPVNDEQAPPAPPAQGFTAPSPTAPSDSADRPEQN